jgi:uroporphyrinogen decarboxylase
MGLLAEVVRRYLRAQVNAGAQAVQLFDSWVGTLDPVDYGEFVAPYVWHILSDIEQTGVPVIHFGTGTGELLGKMRDAGGTVIGVDWRTPLQDAIERLGPSVSVQGNLDPTLLMAPRSVLERRVDDILRAGRRARGHVFNLGHGILPQTPPEAVSWVVERIRTAPPLDG